MPITVANTRPLDLPVDIQNPVIENQKLNAIIKVVDSRSQGNNQRQSKPSSMSGDGMIVLLHGPYNFQDF